MKYEGGEWETIDTMFIHLPFLHLHPWWRVFEAFHRWEILDQNKEEE